MRVHQTLDDWLRHIETLPADHVLREVLTQVLTDWAYDQQHRTVIPVTPLRMAQAPGTTATDDPGRWLRFSLPKGVLLLLSPMEYTLGLYRGKMERRGQRFTLNEE
jgi:hypothetical protein